MANIPRPKNKRKRYQKYNNIIMAKKLTTEEFIEKSKKIHGDKYDYSKVNYTNTKSKVTIICKIHGKFDQISGVHLSGSNCPKCSSNRKLTTEEFIENAKKVHTNKYDYSLINYTGNKTKVEIICPVHGKFEQQPNNHINGQGCPKCKNIKNGNRCRLTSDNLIKQFREVHGDKYNYSKMVYENTHSKITIICSKHGEFEQLPLHHKKGIGCSKCNGGAQLTTKYFIEKSKEVHGDKYDYSSSVYTSAKDKIKIICPVAHNLLHASRTVSPSPGGIT